MAHVWQTIEEAAVTLKISTRTIHRRISGGELQTRLENGRREVMVSVPDDLVPPTADETVSADISSSPENHPATRVETNVGDSPMTVADNAGQMALALTEDRFRRAEMALTAYQHSLTIAEDAARRARAGTCFAWITTGVLVTLIILATAWTTHRVTQAAADMQRLTGEVQRLAEVADVRAEELERAQKEEGAQVAAARMQGELHGRLMRQTDPTTRPSSFFQRLTQIWQEKAEGT